jgi:hypothetical protein
MSPDWVAQQVVKQAKADVRNIIVTINPLTFIVFPVKEFFVSLYFQIFSRKAVSLTDIELERSGVEVITK